MEPIYQIRSSPIDGMGLFALRPFHAGEDMPHIIEVFSTAWVIENFRGFNHSCDPNIKLRTKEHDGYLALKDIHPGEELTLSYGLPLSDGKVSNQKSPQDCRCQVCRKE